MLWWLLIPIITRLKIKACKIIIRYNYYFISFYFLNYYLRLSLLLILKLILFTGTDRFLTIPHRLLPLLNFMVVLLVSGIMYHLSREMLTFITDNLTGIARTMSSSFPPFRRRILTCSECECIVRSVSGDTMSYVR